MTFSEMELSFFFIVCLVTTAAAQTTEGNTACGETSYYGPTGVISSPNYPFLYNRDLNCNYYVYASTGSSISFIFKAFATEPSFDTVTISCPTNSSFPPQRYSGKSLPNPVSIPWCSQGLVNFLSDDTTVDTGFSLNYYVSEGGCQNTVYNESQGYVTSPNWPSDYGYNHSCLNIILAPQRSTFHLTFQAFNLHSCCNCDYLEIRCLDNSENGPETFCENYNNHMMYVYRCSQVLLWFHSDDTNNFKGFNIEYNAYTDGGCGATSYYGPSGIISSPNYPGTYYDNMECNFDVYSSTGSSFSFFFKSFMTEINTDYVTVTCTTNSSFLQQRYSGPFLPDPISVPWCSQGTVNFRTDYSIVSTGFSLEYLVSVGGCGNTVYTGSQGYVTSPSYPSNYDDNQSCFNIIWASKPSSFFISFLQMNTEECCDFVELSCLDNAEYVKQKFRGNTIPPPQIISQCTQVLVWFFSDIVTVFEGFNLEYIVTPESGSTAIPSTTTASTTAIVPQACGNISYYGPSGVISSPNYPGNYANDLYCDYYVNASSPSSSIAIIFQAFDTQECCDYVTISCPTNSIYPSVRYSGSTIPQPLSIPWCSKSAINFVTDSSTISTGFSLDYHVSLGGCGDTVYTGSTGQVSSPDYPSNYGINQNCSNIIWARLSSSFSITFLYMNIEECCDFVELSCLDNAEYGSHRFTGTSIPPKLEIPSCTQVLVWFYSDGTVVQEGFNLEYFAATA